MRELASADRNLIDFYIDGGIEFNGFVAGRPNDRFGIGLAYLHICNDARQLDRDAQVFSGVATPVRDYEALLELIYQAQLRPGWLLQPVFQYVFHLAGGAADPRDPTGTTTLNDAAVFGLRTTIEF